MPEQRPNILFLMTDEQRFDHVGYTNPVVKTPNLDALGRESVVFTRAYTTNPSCVPARAAIFTGRYPSQCGAPTFVTYLPPTETKFMSLLRDAGYHTAVIGKQHFGRTDIEKGYDHADIIDCHSPGGNMSAESAANSYHSFLAENGFTHARELCEPQGRFLVRWKAEQRFHIDDFVGERGRQWLQEGRPADTPWFCCVSFPGPHTPMDGLGLPQEALYDPNEIDLPETTFEDLAQKPPHYMDVHGNHVPVDGQVTEDEIRRVRLAYYANVSLIDEKIGRIVQALKEQGIYDNTMIIFTTDHGDFMGDFTRVGKAQYTAEVLMRIPFIIKPPVAEFAGKTESSLISSVDIAATCLAQAEAPIPPNMASRDLSYYWASSDDLDDRDALYMEARDIRTVRTRRWKLSYYKGRPYGELYDLETDPWERRNRWEDPRCAAVKEEMMRGLMDTLIDLSSKAWVPWNDRCSIPSPEI